MCATQWFCFNSRQNLEAAEKFSSSVHYKIAISADTVLTADLKENFNIFEIFWCDALVLSVKTEFYCKLKGKKEENVMPDIK